MKKNDPFASGFYVATKGCKGLHLCPVFGCRHRRNGHKTLCAKHYMRWWRHCNPEKASYATLRDHAKGRRLAFTISFDYWLGLTDAFAYFEQSADCRGDVLSIDRREASKGYEPGNLRVVSISINSAKGNRERYLPENVQALLERKRLSVIEDTEPEEDNCPF